MSGLVIPLHLELSLNQEGIIKARPKIFKKNHVLFFLPPKKLLKSIISPFETSVESPIEWYSEDATQKYAYGILNMFVDTENVDSSSGVVDCYALDPEERKFQNIYNLISQVLATEVVSHKQSFALK